MFTENDREKLLSLARGHNQTEQIRQMLTETGCPSPTGNLAGKAKQYSMSYQKTFNNLQQRIKKAGYNIRREPGPLGGETRATYYIEKENQQ